jgi:transcriptional regulator with XRE-family HTH domain
MSEQLAERVRQVRHERGMTIEGLAFKSGKSVATVQRIETNKHSPSITTLSAVAAALDTTVADLLGDETEVAS